MRAIVIAKPGGPEVLELREVPTPEPSRGEVRVRIRATAVNRADLLQRLGLYAAPPGSPPDIPGLEIAGRVVALGPDVSGCGVFRQPKPLLDSPIGDVKRRVAEAS